MRLSLILPIAGSLALAVPTVIAGTALFAPAQAEEAVTLPPAAYDPPATGLQTIVLAGGCFWGIQLVYQHVEGVTSAVSGYAGGTAETARYELVARETTDHAEAVEVVFDPAVISYGEILRIYFSVAHDPTQLNRQGPDWGRSYRSAVFYADDAQKTVVEDYVAQLDAAKLFHEPIVTALEPLTKFYPAEDYHQDYALRNPFQGYIVVNDRPKVENLATLFPEHLRTDPITVAYGK